MTTTSPAPPATPPRQGMSGARKTLLIVGASLAGLLFMCLAAAVVLLGDEDATTSPPVVTGTTGQPPATTAGPPSGLNQPVRDGKFEFTVTEIECGLSRVGDADFGADAQGQFCVIALRVTNIGDQAQRFLSFEQYAYNAAGQRYSTDDHDSYLDDYLSGREINPGNTATGVILFDIPASASIVELELHDSIFSGGVRVSVAG